MESKTRQGTGFLLAVAQGSGLALLGGGTWLSGIIAGHHLGDEWEGFDLVMGAYLFASGTALFGVAGLALRFAAAPSNWRLLRVVLVIVLEVPTLVFG